MYTIRIVLVTTIINDLSSPQSNQPTHNQKQISFQSILTYNLIDSEGLTNLFIQHIFSKHRLSSHITSNRGTEFTFKFFKALATVLDMKLYFLVSYYLEADRQTERTNQTLEQYLQIYYNYQQSDQTRLLSLVEFTYNNNLFSTMDMLLFFVNKGYYPSLQVQMTYKLISIPAEKFVADLTVMKIKRFDHKKKIKARLER